MAFKGKTGVEFEIFYDQDYHDKLLAATGKYYFGDLVEVTPPAGVTNVDDWSYNAIDVNKYDLTFELKDTAHYQWESGARQTASLNLR